MKKHLLLFISLFVLQCCFIDSEAQFIRDSSQTYFICNAAGAQTSVQAFGDNSGGTYSYWIDKRNGSSGTAIYGQHLDSAGTPLWAAGGKLIYQENAKEVWNMKAVPWQSGTLVSWYQGPFGAGGDTLFCDYLDVAGNSLWANPVVVANKQGNIIYVGFDNLDLYPNDSGATIAYELLYSGGSVYFSMNRIDFAGNLRWPMDSIAYAGNGYYYATADDYHNGLYVAASTGGLGADIYLGHFDFNGNNTISSPVNVSTGPGGRGNSPWRIICDDDTAAYITWASYTAGDISIAKIRPDGTLPWGAARPVCAAAGIQERPEFIISEDTLYVTWQDPRPGSIANYDVYMQKMDTAGNPLWTTDGIMVTHLSAFSPYPRVITSGNNILATFTLNSGFRAQQVQPDSTFLWPANGITVNVPNPPFYGDYVLVPSAGGDVTAIWSETSQNICAARIQPNGILTRVQNLNETTFDLYPNPANQHLHIQLTSGKVMQLDILDATGRIVAQVMHTTKTVDVNVSGLSAGIYTARLSGEGQVLNRKFTVVR